MFAMEPPPIFRGVLVQAVTTTMPPEEERLKKNQVPPGRPASPQALLRPGPPSWQSSGRRPTGLIAQLAALLVLAQALDVNAATSLAGTAMEVDMAGGPLANALLEIGSRYRVMISFPPKLVEGLSAAPLRGRYPLDQALERALRGCDLMADVSPEGVVTLKRSVRAEASPAGTPRPATHAAPAAPEPDDGDVISLRRVVVKAKLERDAGAGFAAPASNTATLMDTPTSQIPQAVSVVTRDMLTAAQARTQLDALEYAAGVISFNRAWGFEMSPKARGFPAQLLMMGLPTYASALSMDAAVIERVEIAKGPSGVVGGVASAEGRGAVVNLVRKAPYAGQKPQAMLRVDSQDGGTTHLTADLGGGDGPVLWRLVSYGMHSGRTDGGYAPVHATGALGSARYHAKDVTVALNVQREQRRSVFPRLLDTRQGSGPDATSGMQITGEPPVVSRNDGRSARVSGADVDVEWRLSDGWRLGAKGRREQTATDSVISGYSAEHGQASVVRFADKVDGKAWRLSLRGDLGTGHAKHRLLLASDMQSFRSTAKSTSAGWVLDPETFVPGETPLPPTPTLGSLDLQDTPTDLTSERGLLVQHQLHIGDLSTRLAVRRARFSNGLDTDPQRIVSGRNWDAGAAYRLTPAMTVYAGTQSALEASHYAGQTLMAGYFVTPARSRQRQIGAKLDLLEGSLGFSAEAYRLRQGNVLHYLYDENGNALPFTSTGLAADGVELELAGRASAALDLAIGVNALRAREERSNASSALPFWVGCTAAPRRTMHLLARYRLPASVASGLSASVAMKAQSSSWASVPDPGLESLMLRIPGGARLDMSLTRQVERWSFGLSVQNVFNRRLYSPTDYAARVALQPPRSFGLTLGYGG